MYTNGTSVSDFPVICSSLCFQYLYMQHNTIARRGSEIKTTLFSKPSAFTLDFGHLTFLSAFVIRQPDDPLIKPQALKKCKNKQTKTKP